MTVSATISHRAGRWPLTIALGAIALVALLACLPLLHTGAVDGHSIEYNLVWLKHFAAQLGNGDWYPRWLMGMNRGAGSPVFFYYAPLPFYITSLGVGLFPHLNLNMQLAVGECLLIALSGVAFFFYARRHAGLIAAVLSACLYMLLPYHFEVDLWLRQDLGELTLYIFMPLALLCTEQIFASARMDRRAVAGLALSYAGLMFSHLPSALLFSICLGMYVPVFFARDVMRAHLRDFAVAIGLGIALAAVYWVPALFTQGYIQSDKLWTPYFDFHRWLYPATNESANPFTRRLIAVINLTTVLFALLWLTSWLSGGRKMTRHLAGIFVLMLTAWFLISPASVWLWEYAPALHKVQFPWRVIVVMDLATAMAALHMLHSWRLRSHIGNAALTCGVAAVLIYTAISADVKNNLGPVDNARAVTDQFYAVRDGLDAPEYTTPWSRLSAKDIAAKAPLDNRIEYNRSAGAVRVSEWEPGRISLNVKLAHPTELEVRQFYFPNWTVFSKGLRSVLTLQPAAHTGLLRMRVPAGQYQLNLAMAPLLQEWIGGTVSAIALLVVAALWVVGRKRKLRVPNGFLIRDKN